MGCRFKTSTLQDNKAYDRYNQKAQRWAAMIEKMPEPGCTDDWADDDGHDCDHWARNNICRKQLYSTSGVSWGPNFSALKGGSLNDWKDRFGRTANVCKACGCGQGGHRHPRVNEIEREATVGYDHGGWTAAEAENIKNSGRATFYIGNTEKKWYTPAVSGVGATEDFTFDLKAFADRGYMTHGMQGYKQCTGKETDLGKWFQDNVQRGNVLPNSPEQCAIMCASYGKAGCCEWQYDQMGCRFKTSTLQDNKAYDRYNQKAQRWAAMIEKMPEPGCTDDWADDDGHDCDHWARNNICRKQLYSTSGVSWGPNFSALKGGSLNDWKDRFGRTANVCKACGCGQGGHRHPRVNEMQMEQSAI